MQLLVRDGSSTRLRTAEPGDSIGSLLERWAPADDARPWPDAMVLARNGMLAEACGC